MVLDTGANQVNLDLPFADLFKKFGHPDPVALDLLIVASICYLVDKTVPRSAASDGWTREIDLELPVSDPGKWGAVRDDLQTALRFLTGDAWRLSFRDLGGVSIYRRPPGLLMDRRRLGLPEAVCLFSGGMDSLLGAIDLLASSPKRLLLVGHFDIPGPKSQQEALVSSINHRFPNRAELISIRVAHRPSAAPELTLRSRSFLFLALAVYCAKGLGEDTPIFAPENGPIAVNVPLTPARTGSCSTRTMHPFFLNVIRRCFGGLGFGNAVMNPFELKTKGECLRQCADTGLAQTLAPLSVSCSHGTRRKDWVRRTGISNCGYCVPCLFRRAALNMCGLDVGQAYGVDVCHDELDLASQGKMPDDFRAVLDFLRDNRSREQVARAISAVAPIPNLTQHADVVWRGLEEVRLLLATKGSARVKRAMR